MDRQGSEFPSNSCQVCATVNPLSCCDFLLNLHDVQNGIKKRPVSNR